MYILEDILDTLSARMQDAPAPLITAVDGRCAAGKTTLAARLSEALGAPVFHMDDFYLPFARRTPQRLALPGGHMDSERLEAEILRPAAEGKEIIYRPYDAHADRRGAETVIAPQKIYIVEGTYCLLPALDGYYGYKIFLTLDEQTQRARLLEREGEEKLPMFLSRWIPTEEKYFAACSVRQRTDAAFDTSQFSPAL